MLKQQKNYGKFWLYSVTMSQPAELTLHKECLDVLAYYAANPPPPWSSLTVPEIRKAHRERSTQFAGGLDAPFLGVRHLVTVPSKHDAAGIEAYHYVPQNLPANPTIMVYFHGGGCTLGSKDSYDSTCKFISQNTPCVVVNADYRLAPEHMFPACMDDAMTVTLWVLQNKRHLGGTEASPVGIAGDSAGGTIAASVTHDVPELKFQVLIYPHVTPARDYSLPSFTKYKDGPILTLPLIKWFEGNYVPVGEERNPRVASILRPEFSHLPPALVLVAEHDPLYDGSLAYANKLQEHGVEVETLIIPGAMHAFFHYRVMCPTLTNQAHQKIVEFLKARF